MKRTLSLIAVLLLDQRQPNFNDGFIWGLTAGLLLSLAIILMARWTDKEKP